MILQLFLYSIANNYNIDDMAKGERPKEIILRKIPDEVWQKIRKVKLDIMQKNTNRGNVSHQEAIYKLIKNNCTEL